MKQRFSALDCTAMSHELRLTLVGMRLQNIYDLSSRIFLLKFGKPDHREQLIIDIGFRCHLTNFARTTASEPSAFVRRLRKTLGTRRITSVSQVGTDRIIDIQFSDGLYHLYLEFYAAGNLLVTDNEGKILALFRNVSEGAEHQQVKLGVVYSLTNFEARSERPELSVEWLKSALQDALEKENPENVPKKKKKSSDLRRAIAQIFREWPPVLIDHSLSSTKFDTSTSLQAVLDSPELLSHLTECLIHANSVRPQILDSHSIPSYIFAKTSASAEAEATRLLYDDYEPFKPAHLEANSALTCLEYPSFNKAVDEFYSSIEGQKLDTRLQEKEANAKKKLEETKRMHYDRVGTLQQAQLANVKKAEAIEANIERVQEAIDAVNGLIAQGMDWADIARLIEAEQKRANPVAQIIKLPLKLHENTVTLLLSGPGSADDDLFEDKSDESESESEPESEVAAKSKSAAAPPSKVAVDVDLSLSPWSNATQYYEQKRTAAEKQKRTAEVSNQALQSAERKVAADLKKALSQEKDILRPLRQTFWFEKFFFFFSSDGYLVLGAKDPGQADIIYNRHLNKGDVYVHADVSSALQVVIKNKPGTPDAPIPPSTLSQAGTYSVCASTAWDSKALMPAWWVMAEQVGKINPHGDLLGPGDFHIKGEKNYLPPAQLLVGIGILFQITEESKANHTRHRVAEQAELPAAETDSKEDVVPEAAKLDEEEQKDAAESSDESEDFPDAAPVSAIDSDDEDFPDVNPLQLHDSDDEASDTPASNPLHSDKSAQIEDSTTTSLEAQADDDGASVVTTDTTATKSTRRHLSAKERRLLKKGITPSQQPQTPLEENSDDDGNLSDAPSLQTTTTITSKNPSSTPLPRGKRTKQKKAAVKYAHQDEDDRIAALARLGVQGSSSGANKKELEAMQKREREQAELAAKQRRREQHLRKQALGRAAEEKRKVAFAVSAGGEGGAEAEAAGAAADEEEAQAGDVLASLDCLTGKPLPGDTILTAIPLCAPWTALAAYKYKVKAQPGAVKRGKAAREVLGKWQADGKVAKNVDAAAQDGERMWPREVELLSGVREAEVVGVMPVGKVRIMVSGGSGGGGGGGGNKKGDGKGGNKGGKGSGGGKGAAGGGKKKK